MLGLASPRVRAAVPVCRRVLLFTLNSVGVDGRSVETQETYRA
jgi:hypothetical protein